MKDQPLTRFFMVLGVIIAIIVILYFGSGFLVPLAFGAVLAMLLDPLYEKLQAKGMNRGWALTVSMLVIIVIILGLVGLIYWQVTLLSRDWPQIQEQLTQMKGQFMQYLQSQFGLTEEQVNSRVSNALKNVQGAAVTFIGSFTTLLSLGLLTLVYIVLFLLEKKRFLATAERLASGGNKRRVVTSMQDASEVSRKYLVGKFKMMGILTAIYIAGFMIGGVKYAILLAVQAGLFSIIPYVGNLIGGGIAAVLALVSGGGIAGALIVIGVMSVAQLLENYLLEPWIVGDAIDLNPFVVITSVVGFSIVWGVGGAILALPIIGMVKVIADHWPQLSWLSVFLGGEPPEKAG